MNKILVLFFLFMSFFSNHTFGQKAGDLDSTFGINGKVITAISTIQDILVSIALQKDGKIVGGGQTYQTAYSDFAIVRYNNDGFLDTSFGKGGKVITEVSKSFDEIIKVAIQPDGKIVAVGPADFNGNSDFAVVRYNKNGALDTTFSKDGIFTLDISNNYDVAWSLVFQPDGKIVVGGEAKSNFAIIRLNSNGTLDTSFGQKGISTINFKSYGAKAYCMELQTDGKFVLAGYSFININQTGFALARFKSNGSIDSTFSNDGMLVTKFDTIYDGARTLAIQPDGKIILAGYSKSSANTDFALARYNKNGTLDSSFDFDGKITTKIGSGDEEIYSIGLQTNNKIVVSGYSKNKNTTFTNKDFALARYNVNGSLDTSFNSIGTTTCGIENSEDESFSVVIQSDGKILTGGYSRESLMSPLKFALARFFSDSPKANFTFTDVCEDDSVSFINKSQNATRYIWKFGDGDYSTKISAKHLFKINGVSQTFNVSLVSSIGNGYKDSIIKPVTVNASPKSDYTYTASKNQWNFNPSQLGNTKYRWLFGDGDSAIAAAASHSYKDGLPSHTVCLKATNAASCISETCKLIATTGVSYTKSSGFKIYPNPNSGNFTIEIDNPEKDISVEVYNSLGELVKKVERVGKVIGIDLDVSAGIYLVKLRNGGVVYNEKLSIK